MSEHDRTSRLFWDENHLSDRILTHLCGRIKKSNAGRVAQLPGITKPASVHNNSAVSPCTVCNNVTRGAPRQTLQKLPFKPKTIHLQMDVTAGKLQHNADTLAHATCCGARHCAPPYLWPTAAEVLAVVAAKPASFERLEAAIMELAIAPALCIDLHWAVEDS